MTPEEQLKVYENDTNAEQNIRNTISAAYKDLTPEANLVNTYYNQQFPSFYKSFNTGYGVGTGASDLTPTTLLQNAFNNAGNDSTVANTASSVFDTRKASMEDLINSAYSQWQNGYTGAQNAYDRWWAQQQAEEAKREFYAQLAKSGTTTATVNTPTNTTSQSTSAYQQYLSGLYNSGVKNDPTTGQAIVGMSTNSGPVYWLDTSVKTTPKTQSTTSSVSPLYSGYLTPQTTTTSASTTPNFSILSKYFK